MALAFKSGDKVTYVPVVGKPENGIVKSLSPGYDAVFVVYHCNNEWDNYMNYTAAHTPVDRLVMGWTTG